MIQKCSYLNVLKVFFEEPTTIHFIREISKKINLAPTSVRKNINELLKQRLIIPKNSKPFNGYIANREENVFIFYKRVYNLYSLENIKNYFFKEICPDLVVVFGSYSLGEDVETSDIDLIAVSKVKRETKFEKIKKLLGREINLMIVDDLDRLDRNIKKKVLNGIVLYGEIE